MRGDQLFGFAARCDARRRDYFLQSFERHGQIVIAVASAIASGGLATDFALPHRARGFAQRFKLGFRQLAIAASRNPFHADRPERDANPLFDRVAGLEQDAPQFFFLVSRIRTSYQKLAARPRVESG